MKSFDFWVLIVAIGYHCFTSLVAAKVSCFHFFLSEDRYISCDLDVVPSVQFVSLVLDINRPLKYIDNVRSSLCIYSELCNFRYAEILRATIIKQLMNSGIISDIKPYVAVNALFLHQTAINMNQYGNAMDVSLLQWQWTPSPTVSVIVILDAPYVSEQLIKSLKEDLDSLEGTCSVVLLFGLVLSSGESTAMYDPFVAALHAAFPRVDWKLYAFYDNSTDTEVGSEWIGWHVTSESRDHRSMLADIAHSTYNTDYYILTECMALQEPGWLAPPLSPFLYRRDLHPNLGVSVNMCPEEVQTVSALSRLHFEIFAGQIWFSISTGLTNLLLLDVYSVVDSHLVYCKPYSRQDTVNFQSLDDFEDYVDQLQHMRVHLLKYLNTKLYARNPIPWSLQNTVMRPTDVLYASYCGLTGCSTAAATGDDNDSSPLEPRAVHPQYAGMARIAYITSLFGSYETQLHPFVRQSIPADFICFTDQPDIPQQGGWILDTHPYHWDALQYDVDHNMSHHVNSLHNNKHPFNMAKYYKTNFHRIPRLAQYDVVVWIDATIRIENPNTSEILMKLIKEESRNFLIFQDRNGTNLQTGFDFSFPDWRYNSDHWFGHPQPLQKLKEQHHDYFNVYHHDMTLEHVDGYTQGTWMTCFVAMDMRKTETVAFLTRWNEEIVKYSMNDQLSLIFLAQQMQMYPYTLPDPRVDNGIYGNFVSNSLYSKMQHGGLSVEHDWSLPQKN